MKVLHITTPVSWRGGEQQLAYLIEELNKKNVIQWVLCSANSKVERYCIENNINFFLQNKPTSFSFLSALKIAKLCKSLKIDLIHVHDSHAHSAVVLSTILFKNTIPVILSRKVDFSIRKNWVSIYKYNHFCIKKIICVSEKIKEILSPDIRNKEILTAVYDGIDFLRFKWKPEGLLRKEYKIENDELIIGNVAAIAPHKDYFTFVDTAEIILKKNVKARFFIIGEGNERKNIEQYIATKKLQDKIIMTGFRTDIPRIFPELDFFLFTSKTEGLGSSILDAYLCKVPVVATSAGGVPEIVIHNKTGLVSPPQNPSLLAENILKLISNTDLKESLIYHANEFVKNFSKEKTAEQTLKIYKQVFY